MSNNHFEEDKKAGGWTHLSRRCILALLGTVPMVGRTKATDTPVLHQQEVKAVLDEPPKFDAPSREIPENPLIEIDYHLYGALGTHAYPDLWVETDPDAAREEILRFDPDMSFPTSFGAGPPPRDSGIGDMDTKVGLLNRRFGIPGGSGDHFHMSVYSEIYQEWYESLPEDQYYTHPDGHTVEHLEELSGENFDGSRWGTENVIIPSLFSDGTVDFWHKNIRQNFEFNVKQFWIDGLGILLAGPLDFSDWATTEFNAYIQNLPSDRLSELGINDPETFNIRDYLVENQLTPSDSGNPITDPVVQELAIYQSRSYKDFIKNLFDAGREGVPEESDPEDTALFGNQFGLQPNILRCPAFYLSDVVDHIQIEIGPPNLPPTLPPREHPMAIKTGRAAGRFEKPVRVYSTFGALENENPEQYGLDSAGYYPTLKKFEAAQSYAHGAIPAARMTHREGFENMINTWMRADGSVDETLHEFIDFIRSHRRFLTETSEANNAVIALSLPTIFWLWVSESWGDPARDPLTEGMSGVGAALRREHVSYDVRILDYPPIWEAPTQTNALTEFDLIILPNVTCLSDDHVQSLEEALDEGATVIATGGVPTRTADFEPRDDVKTLLNNEKNGIIVEGHPDIDGGNGAAMELRNAIPEESRTLQLGIDGDVSLNVFEQTNPDRVIVHVLNYEYDSETDSMDTKTDVDLTVHDLPFEPTAARYYEEGNVTDLPLTTDGDEASTTIPELHIWGFVVFVRDEKDLYPETSKQTAEKYIAEATELLDLAREKNREELLQRAEGKLLGAETVFEYESYDEAKKIAVEAAEWVENAYRLPRIGIDASRGQKEVYNEYVAQFKDEFNQYEIVEIDDSWTESTFESIDIFIYPANHRSESQQFSSNELALVETFVRNGGTLIIVSQSYVSEDINDIASQFGFTFEPYPIVVEEGSLNAPFEQTALTPRILDLGYGRANWGNPLRDVEDVTVFSRLPEDTEAVIEKPDGDEPAAGAPFGAVTKYGEGLVIGFGTSTIITELSDVSVLSQFLNYGGKHARYAQRGSLSTEVGSDENGDSNQTEGQAEDGEGTQDATSGEDDAESQDAESEDDAESHEETVPGFGIGSALAGLGGAGYLLKRRLSDDETDSK